ncbi:AraC family ligand binding domain-containing protein [Haladaptatus pallidirubidus]|uniref:AraC family ligand binding domain-containing protein n=1 Tax=Haladaptatus pallidirubidus TaxID=1008152 RepID=UPI001D10F883
MRSRDRSAYSFKARTCRATSSRFQRASTRTNTHETESIIMILRGEWVLCDRGERRHMTASDMFWFNPGVPTGTRYRSKAARSPSSQGPANRSVAERFLNRCSNMSFTRPTASKSRI